MWNCTTAFARGLEWHSCCLQGIEGISLGCTFIDAKYGRLKYFLFAAAYVIVTPIGIGAPRHPARCRPLGCVSTSSPALFCCVPIRLL